MLTTFCTLVHDVHKDSFKKYLLFCSIKPLIDGMYLMFRRIFTQIGVFSGLTFVLVFGH
jgi:hypothetical protein